MTDLRSTSIATNPSPQPPPRVQGGGVERPWLVLLIAATIFSSLSIWAAVKSQGFLEADACTHYQYARFALGETHYLVNVWGRPFVTALYAIPAVLTGRIGVRMTSLVCALLIALAAYRIAKKLDYRYPALAFIFTLAQPLLFLHSFAELTELPFALLLSLAFWAYVQRQWLAMAIIASLLPTARPEGFGFLVLAAVALMFERKIWVAILPIPLLIWTYAGWRIYGSPVYTDSLAAKLPHTWHWLLWLRHEWPYSQVSTYKPGSLFKFIAVLPAIVSPLIFPFMLIGIPARLRLRDALKNHQQRCEILIAFLPLMILTVHSLLYWLGRMASNGEARYMLVVAPFWALLAARGFEFVWARFHWRHVYPWAAVMALAPLATHLFYPVWSYLPLSLSADGLRARETAQWYQSDHVHIDYPTILCSNPEVAYFMGVSHTDRGWVREWTKKNAAKPIAGTLMIWDPVYALYNADAQRVVTLKEIQAAGWVERPDLAEPINAIESDRQWRIFLSPKTIFGKDSQSQ